MINGTELKVMFQLIVVTYPYEQNKSQNPSFEGKDVVNHTITNTQKLFTGKV